MDGYVYNKKTKDGIVNKSKEEILGKGGFSLKEKLKVMLPEILKASNPTKEKWWGNFLALEQIRDKIIHTKQSKSEERYSDFLNKNIFKWVEVNKEIIKFYGYYINENLKKLLIDYPYGFGFDNVLPSFITQESYMKTSRRMSGIPDEK